MMQAQVQLQVPATDNLTCLDRAWGRDLRACFRAAGYTSASVAEVEKAIPGLFEGPRRPLIARMLNADPRPSSILLRLFSYDLPVPAAAAAAVLGELIAPLRTAGILESDPQNPGALRSLWRLAPFEGLWVLSDRPDAGSEAVMGPGPTTAALARAALPVPTGTRVLDLGCGAGSLALVAAAAGAVVTATDVSARAVAVCAANAILNDCIITVLVGDGVAPVATQCFDLVVCQPPYVIRPTDTPAVTYLHGGARGDELARKLTVAIPKVLAADGLAFLSFDAPSTPQDNLADELAAAFAAESAANLANQAESAVDVVVFACASPGLDQLAMAYASVADLTLGDIYAAAATRYREHCATQGFTAFQRNLVVLRRPARGYAMQIPAAGSARLRRMTVDRLLASADAALLDDADVLGLRIVPVPEASLVRRQSFAGGAVTQRMDFSDDGWCPNHEISDGVAILCSLLAQCPDVDAAIVQYAEACAAQPGEVAAQVLAFVRDGLRRGVLHCAGV